MAKMGRIWSPCSECTFSFRSTNFWCNLTVTGEIFNSFKLYIKTELLKIRGSMASLARNLFKRSVRTLGRRNYSHLSFNTDGKFTCTLIPGDGVGPELVNQEFFKLNL
jgi:hypothetical protein